MKRTQRALDFNIAGAERFSRRGRAALRTIIRDPLARAPLAHQITLHLGGFAQMQMT
ncbi:MAG: hypothetical protein HYS63_03055 [Methylocystis sp.]|nr:hypothetical protein [Methylocystis sp.]